MLGEHTFLKTESQATRISNWEHGEWGVGEERGEIGPWPGRPGTFGWRIRAREKKSQIIKSQIKSQKNIEQISRRDRRYGKVRFYFLFSFKAKSPIKINTATKNPISSGTGHFPHGSVRWAEGILPVSLVQREESSRISFLLCSYHRLVIEMTDRISTGNYYIFSLHFTTFSPT